MMTGCPGAGSIRGTPALKIRDCPECGGEIEIFSIDRQAVCDCGFVVYNDIQSCVLWCGRARECVGEETYRELTEKRTIKE
ncbi:MAG: hypothetical protein FWD81_05700 [Methanomassiliicoccaceae archaeon]|nr:hypothetical protein [Methanomassiliicoccaceae archaeon]